LTEWVRCFVRSYLSDIAVSYRFPKSLLYDIVVIERSSIAVYVSWVCRRRKQPVCPVLL